MSLPLTDMGRKSGEDTVHVVPFSFSSLPPAILTSILIILPIIIIIHTCNLILIST